MSRKYTDKELDSLGRNLFKVAKDGEESPDGVFLAGFHKKLDQARSSNRLIGASIGEWSWKLSPLTVAASALLAISLIAVRSGEELYMGANEQILWNLIDEEDPEMSKEVILEAMLWGSKRR